MDQLYDTEPGQPRVPLRATADGYLLVQIAGGGGGGGGSSVTNLSTTVSPTEVVVASDTGTDATIPVATTTDAGVMPPAAVQQLAGLGTASTASASEFATSDQGTKADTALQPGALPAGTTVTASQISDAGAAGRTLLQKATLPEIRALVSGAGEQAVATGLIWGHMGDSHTFGVGASNAGSRGYLACLRQRVGGLVVSPSSINAGVSGTDTANMLTRLPALIAQNPAAITIFGGTNDALGGISVATYTANISAMIDLCKAAMVPCYVGSPPPLGPARSASMHKLVQAYVYAVRKLCASKGVRYVPVHEALADPATGYRKTIHAYTDDDHFNDVGHAAISAPFAAAILADLYVQGRPVAARSLHNTISNPTVQGTIGVGALPTGIAVNGTPTGTLPTYRVRAKQAGDSLQYGNWLELEWDTSGVDSYIEINANPWVNPTAGDVLAYTYVYEVDAVSATWATMVAAGAEVVTNLIVGASYAGGANIGYVEQGRVYIVAGTAAAAYALLRVRITRKAGQALRVRIGELGVINESTLGMSLI